MSVLSGTRMVLLDPLSPISSRLWLGSVEFGNQTSTRFCSMAGCVAVLVGECHQTIVCARIQSNPEKTLCCRRCNKKTYVSWFYYCDSSIFGLTEELMGSVITKINIISLTVIFRVVTNCCIVLVVKIYCYANYNNLIRFIQYAKVPITTFVWSSAQNPNILRYWQKNS